MELLYGCGLRVSELVNLKLSNIDLKSKYIQCYGKGSKERVVPFGKKPKLHWKIFKISGFDYLTE